MLEHPFEPRPFLAAGGIWLMAPVAFRVVDFAAGGLLWVKAKFSVRFTPLDVASRRDSKRQQDAQCSEGDLHVNPIKTHHRKLSSNCISFRGRCRPRRCEPLQQ